jgi:hypothetical protein
MVECEVIDLYKYTIKYKRGEKDEYEIILVSDNMKDMIELIADREMIDPMGAARKWFEITDFVIVMDENKKWYHLFDINEQDLAVKFGYDVQEQYWKCQFKNDCPESVKYYDEAMGKFVEEIKMLHPDDKWAKDFASGGILGDALYNSHYVQDAIRDMKREKYMHDAQELDAGINMIEEIMKGEKA